MIDDKTCLNLAIEALRNYGIENPQIKRLGGASNTNFKVDIDDKSYVLRLHTSNARHDRDAISSELFWLKSLHNASLVVPKPIVNLKGELVTSVPADSEKETLCTLMQWIEGKIPPTIDAMTNEQLVQTGSLMAQLHIHSQQFKIPTNYKRHTFDTPHFSGRLEVLYTALSNTELDKSELNNFKSNASRIINYYTQLERKQDTFGLIHADFHSGNYLLHNDKVHIIDFDLCGFGFYFYDLALALMEQNITQREAFLQGYEKIKPLPANYTKLKHLFLSLAYLDNLGFLVANQEELPFVIGEFPFVVEAFRHAVENIT
ncbi:aminoglycoside phosphotransferase [Calothrix sp. PCC 7716]|nr:aminoglycoside phosphotransferase [Calothrix sp. PCC 7716]